MSVGLYNCLWEANLVGICTLRAKEGKPRECGAIRCSRHCVSKGASSTRTSSRAGPLGDSKLHSTRGWRQDAGSDIRRRHLPNRVMQAGAKVWQLHKENYELPLDIW